MERLTGHVGNKQHNMEQYKKTNKNDLYIYKFGKRNTRKRKTRKSNTHKRN